MHNYSLQFTRKPREFSIDVEQDRDLAVSKPKPGQVKVFQYYETGTYCLLSSDSKALFVTHDFTSCV